MHIDASGHAALVQEDLQWRYAVLHVERVWQLILEDTMSQVAHLLSYNSPGYPKARRRSMACLGAAPLSIHGAMSSL
jgi:hypothetical protein